MARFLDTRGHTTLAIGICARCSCKFPLDELTADPNYPGLYVCSEDKDDLDPYRMPARQADNITVDHPRPDVALVPNGPTLLFGDLQIDGLASINAAKQWRPRTFFKRGDTVYVGDINNDAVQLPVVYYVCLADGYSGDVAPTEIFNGVIFREAP